MYEKKTTIVLNEPWAIFPASDSNSGSFRAGQTKFYTGNRQVNNNVKVI